MTSFSFEVQIIISIIILCSFSYILIQLLWLNLVTFPFQLRFEIFWVRFLEDTFWFKGSLKIFWEFKEHLLCFHQVLIKIYVLSDPTKNHAILPPPANQSPEAIDLHTYWSIFIKYSHQRPTLSLWVYYLRQQ